MNFTELTHAALEYNAALSHEECMQLPNLRVLCESHVSTFNAVVYQPVICLILQGAKVTTIGDQTIHIKAGEALLVSHDLPVISKITSATPDSPYLALILSLDINLVRNLYEEVESVPEEYPGARSLCSGPADQTWVEPLSRYLGLKNTPLDAQVLGPSILREIHFRLLMSPLGGMLRNLLTVDSHASRITRAIKKIRSDFHLPLTVVQLAKLAGMGQSSFHEHFKLVTGTTPLQFQKDMRMITARDLLQSGEYPVSMVSFEVGYESPTHFSRDYTRKFGIPPSRELRKLAASA